MSELKECLEHGAGTCRNADMIDELRAELVRRDEIIARLKEDAERLAKLNCHCHDTRGMTFLDDNYHAPDCPITLHRALMKELEEE